LAPLPQPLAGLISLALARMSGFGSATAAQGPWGCISAQPPELIYQGVSRPMTARNWKRRLGRFFAFAGAEPCSVFSQHGHVLTVRQPAGDSLFSPLPSARASISTDFSHRNFPSLATSFRSPSAPRSEPGFASVAPLFCCSYARSLPPQINWGDNLVLLQFPAKSSDSRK
jgi:hypothetical protein